MCLQYIDIKQKKLKQFYHNPRVGGSSPSSATTLFLYTPYITDRSHSVS